MRGNTPAQIAVSIVIPTRNRAWSLRRTLAALDCQTDVTERFEVIVVANACTDETSSLAHDLSTSYLLRLLELPAPGISLARNAGVAAAQGQLLIFLDDDIVPTPGFMAAHLRAHGQEAKLVAIGRLLTPPLPQPVSFFIERLHRFDLAFASFLAERQGQLNWCCMLGGNFSIAKDLFWEANGFDTALRAYGGDDYEFGCRVQKLGAYFRFLPEAGGFHYAHENKSLASSLCDERSRGRNAVYIVKRHPEILDELRIGLIARPQTKLGRLARTLAFDHPDLGDLLAKGLLWTGAVLEWLRLRRPWNRLMDCLSQYWYFRGVREPLGNYQAVLTYLMKLKAVAPGNHES